MVATLTFAGTAFAVMGQAALYWPERGALIVADLHLEKASSYAAGGQMLPPYDSRATLEELAGLIRRSGARAVWCLGDNFHDSAGQDRLEGEAEKLLDRMTSRLDWRWIIGNHDPGLGPQIGGHVLDEMVVDGILFRHEAVPHENRPEMSGHFHPKYRQQLRGRMVARRCFVRTAGKLILPAFGALTGGLDADDPAIASALGCDAWEAVVPAAGRALSFPLKARAE